ncbi:MAG: NAD-dependent epimerase/dehydratase family protein [Anaerolineae bacterium]|nr:NAD-dependent epimerase/dehydratase family protein [Anaerolineae bacterium]
MTLKALVTGGGGFIGSFVVEQLLQRGDSVTVFARGDYPQLAASGARVIRGDVQDAAAITEACAGHDIVFHIAAKAGIWGTWESFYGPNVAGTENVIAACHAQGISRLVYTSSPSVVFDGHPQEGVDETVAYPQHYESLYARAKSIAEQRVLAANGQGGLLTVSLRPHFVFGPRDTHITLGLIERARAKKMMQVGLDTVKKDLSYVEDVAWAHLLAADALQPGSPLAGSAYFISQGEPVLFWQWVADLLQALGLPGIQRKIPLGLAQTVGTGMEWVYRVLPLRGEPLLTRFLVNEMGQSQYYSIERARRDFGYVPRYTIAQALEKTVAYWRERLAAS